MTAPSPDMAEQLAALTREVARLRKDAREALALAAGLREDLAAALARIRELEERDELDSALDRISALEAQTPQARQRQYEADAALADAAEYDRHGCGCPECYNPEPEVQS